MMDRNFINDRKTFDFILKGLSITENDFFTYLSQVHFTRDSKWFIALPNLPRLIETSDNIFGITRELPGTLR